MLTIALIFVGTLNFSEAASKSTTKIISDLKKEVKKLTASNKTKDKEIAKLKNDIKNRDVQIKQKNNIISSKDKVISMLNNDNKKLREDVQIKDQKIRGTWELQNKYRSFISHYIGDAMNENGKVKAYCQQNPDDYCNADIKVRGDEFYIKSMFDYITKQELKSIVIDRYKSLRDPWINSKNIIITTPEGDLVIPLSTEL